MGRNSSQLRINLGSGIDYRKEYWNIDNAFMFKKDVHYGALDFVKTLKAGSTNEIITSHIINYFYYWELRELFELVKNSLEEGGKWVIENPDLQMVLEHCLRSSSLSQEYFECVRALFAFDMKELGEKRKYTPYVMAYRKSDIYKLCEEYGFDAKDEEPSIHKTGFKRDFRLVLTKREGGSNC